MYSSLNIHCIDLHSFYKQLQAPQSCHIAVQLDYSAMLHCLVVYSLVCTLGMLQEEMSLVVQQHLLHVGR